MPKFLNRILGKKKNKKTEDDGEGEGDAGEGSETSASDGVGPLDFPDDCEGNASGADLVFVHGLRGSRLKTWSSGDVFWPRDLLKDDVKNARVITWGYDASVANAFTYASKESIFGHADTLLSDLARLRRGIVCLSILVEKHWG
jgi:protein SERAC1